MGFSTHIKKRIEMIFHTCGLESGLILHTGKLASGFFYSHMWTKKMVCTLASPQVVFFIYIGENKMISHTCKLTNKSLLWNCN